MIKEENQLSKNQNNDGLAKKQTWIMTFQVIIAVLTLVLLWQANEISRQVSLTEFRPYVGIKNVQFHKISSTEGSVSFTITNTGQVPANNILFKATMQSKTSSIREKENEDGQFGILFPGNESDLTVPVEGDMDKLLEGPDSFEVFIGLTMVYDGITTTGHKTSSKYKVRTQYGGGLVFDLLEGEAQ